MNQNNTLFSKRLNDALLASGKKQVDLVRETGIDSAAMSCYFSGKYGPKRDRLLLIADALQVSPMWLVGLESEGEKASLLSKTSAALVAENLRFYMALYDKSRRDISNDLSISYYTITDWVNGKKMPRGDTLQVLADYFGISIADLLEDKTAALSENDMEKPEISVVLQKLSCDRTFKATVLALSSLSQKQSSKVYSKGKLLGTVIDISNMTAEEQDIIAVFVNAMKKQREEYPHEDS